LEDDSDLIGMTRFLVNNLDERQIGPSGPELIDVYEIVGLDNPKIITP
jgi:hypothetical protein